MSPEVLDAFSPPPHATVAAAPGETRPARGNILRRAALLVGILLVVFVIVLPRIVDYRAVAAARATLSFTQLALLIATTAVAAAIVFLAIIGAAVSHRQDRRRQLQNLLAAIAAMEAAIFIGGPDNGVWDLLHEIEVPVLVLAGAYEPEQPSASAEQIADELPRGELRMLPHLGHLGPFSHPAEVAALVSASV